MAEFLIWCSVSYHIVAVFEYYVMVYKGYSKDYVSSHIARKFYGYS